MSKIKLLLDVVSDMRSLADSLEAVAKAITESEHFDEPATEPEAAPDPPQDAITLETVRGILSQKSLEGHGTEIRTLLQRYGHTKLSEIDPKDYPALLADAEVL